MLRFAQHDTPLPSDGKLRDSTLGSPALQQVQVAAGAVDVAGDLLTQGLDRRELDLRADAPEKEDLHLGLGGEGEGMEVEQMALDSEGLGAEGGPHAHVG